MTHKPETAFPRAVEDIQFRASMGASQEDQATDMATALFREIRNHRIERAKYVHEIVNLSHDIRQRIATITLQDVAVEEILEVNTEFFPAPLSEEIEELQSQIVSLYRKIQQREELILLLERQFELITAGLPIEVIAQIQTADQN